jgi:hypothetical protein
VVPSEVRQLDDQRFSGNLNRNWVDVANAQFAKGHFHNMVEKGLVARDIKTMVPAPLTKWLAEPRAANQPASVPAPAPARAPDECSATITRVHHTKVVAISHTTDRSDSRLMTLSSHLTVPPLCTLDEAAREEPLMDN